MSDPETPQQPAKGPPRRAKNIEIRPREYLTEEEVDRLAKAAGQLGRNGFRDATMIRFAATHGMRASELVKVLRTQLDLDQQQIKIIRAKRGKNSVHPIGGKELRDLKKLLRESRESKYLFVSQLGSALSRNGFGKIVGRAAAKAGLGHLHVHPHMLRHACGYKLANKGTDLRLIQDWMGHRNIQHTVIYTELAAGRFAELVED